jgi:hypothetical protein
MISDFRDTVRDLSGTSPELLRNHRVRREITGSRYRAYFEQDVVASNRSRSGSTHPHSAPEL